MGPIYTVIVLLQCRQVRLYVKTDFLYHSVFTMISAVYSGMILLISKYPSGVLLASA